MSGEPIVCEYLRTHSFADLEREHGVTAGIARTRPYKASLNYDMIASKETDTLACQCRGLIVSTPDGSPLPTDGPVGETIVLARPFDRFFNHGTVNAHALDLAHPATRVFEKVDGTLCIVYFDDHAAEWSVATRSVPDADVPLSGQALSGDGAWTFRALFELALREYGRSFAEFNDAGDSPLTYLYELTTPWNMIVVRHDAPRLHLLAVRDRNGAERCPTEFYGVVPHAPLYPIGTVTELLAFIDSRGPQESEGCVVRMGEAPHFRRVKVKSAAYMAAVRLKDSVGSSPRSMLEVVLLGKDDDVAALLPKPLQLELARIKQAFAAISRRHDDAWSGIIAHAIEPNPRKAVALAVQAAGLMIAPMMDRYTGRSTSFRDWIDRRRDGLGGWGDAFLDSMLAAMRADGAPAQAPS